MNNNTQLWVPVPGYEGLYEVSNDGLIRSLDRTVTKLIDGKTKDVFYRGKMLKQSTAHVGQYHAIALSMNGVSSVKFVHHLVAEAFIGPRPSGYYVCHNDGNPHNNHVNNLRYDTPKSNSADRIKHGTDMSGEVHPRAKLTLEQVNVIKEQLKYKSGAQIARDFNVTEGAINAIKQGKRWNCQV